jgi:UDP-sulfoquinovose synthase
MKMNNRIIVLGGDGFCGWPTSLKLSEKGYDVTIVDDLSKRVIVATLGAQSLTPVKDIETRIERWKKLTNKSIEFIPLDISSNYKHLLKIINTIKPKAIVHFAEQPSAGYSMKSAKHKKYTFERNNTGTHNLLCAIVESGLDIHVVHLGTMGVYGYGTAGMKIPEGYLPINASGVDIEIPYPINPGSVYHMTKCIDATLFFYYNKNDKIRITDLHQGIVYGTQTKETSRHTDLINKFFYDGDMGTVLNRFLMQAAVGHPLTIHGTGGQTRAFIHIRDTVKCVKLAIEHPPKKGERVKIFNQAAESLNIKELALKVQKLTGAEIRYYRNPRNEDAENKLMFSNEGFKSFGWDPILLDKSLLLEVNKIAKQYQHRCDLSKIPCVSTWSKDIEADIVGSEE